MRAGAPSSQTPSPSPAPSECLGSKTLTSAATPPLRTEEEEAATSDPSSGEASATTAVGDGRLEGWGPWGAGVDNTVASTPFRSADTLGISRSRTSRVCRRSIATSLKSSLSSGVNFGSRGSLLLGGEGAGSGGGGGGTAGVMSGALERAGKAAEGNGWAAGEVETTRTLFLRGGGTSSTTRASLTSLADAPVATACPLLTFFLASNAAREADALAFASPILPYSSSNEAIDARSAAAALSQCFRRSTTRRGGMGSL